MKGNHHQAPSASLDPDEAQDYGNTFFDRNTEPRTEIAEGMIREQQLVAFAGPFGTGKSPMLADLAVHVLNGVPWCGRVVEQRPIIHFDLETSAPVYKANIQNMAARLGVPMPIVPAQLDVYLEHDSTEESGTQRLLAALEAGFGARIALIESALNEKPDALVIIDPLELLFRIDTGKKMQILWLYSELRKLLSRYPHAALIITFNLRKWSGKGPQPNLLSKPREWLEEVCGTLDIMNRSDVRLGMDSHDEDVCVVNGIRRGEEMHPLLIRSVTHRGQLAGFDFCSPEDSALKAAFTSKQVSYWNELPAKFRFEQVADKTVPRASLQRLLARAKSLGLVESNSDGLWVKKRCSMTRGASLLPEDTGKGRKR